MTEKFKSESKFFLVGKSTSETSITIHGKQTKFIFRDKHTELLAILGGEWILSLFSYFQNLNLFFTFSGEPPFALLNLEVSFFWIFSDCILYIAFFLESFSHFHYLDPD